MDDFCLPRRRLGFDPQWRRGYKSGRLQFMVFAVTLVSSQVFHASSVSASAVLDVKKGTEYRDLQYNSITVGR